MAEGFEEELMQERTALERWLGEGGSPIDPYGNLANIEERLARPEGLRTRDEHDSMGTITVPAEAYYGAATARALQNFHISGLRFPRSFIRALGLVKLVAAQVNRDLGLLDPRQSDAIVKAAKEVADGLLDDQFVVDVFQTGSGTSTNMNANEVIANRATEFLGGKRGEKLVHANDHVNLGQSSNDVIPTATHLAALSLIEEELAPALQTLRSALEAKAKEFWPVIKTGRTHLQDATPIRLGQEFLGYAGQIERSLRNLANIRAELSEVALGGTGVGTGVNTHVEFGARASELLSGLTGFQLNESENHFQAQSTIDALVQASATLRTTAISLMKIANDVRWMGSGPIAGLGEIELPEVQPGSSLMPGKVNPVIPESLLQVAAQVIGNDAAIAVAGQGGYFELNTMMPVAAWNLLQSLSLLSAATDNFRRLCIDGLKATGQGPALVERNLMSATALAPLIGYDAAAEIAKEARDSGASIRDLARSRTSLSDEVLGSILEARSMVGPEEWTG